MDNLTIAILILFPFMSLGSYIWGYNTGLTIGKNSKMKNIKEYVTEHWPNEEKAYRKGVDEGYDQGLRDGQP